jgi:hypothetical protein
MLTPALAASRARSAVKSGRGTFKTISGRNRTPAWHSSHRYNIRQYMSYKINYYLVYKVYILTLPTTCTPTANSQAWNRRCTFVRTRMPDPWLLDSEALLEELARIRDLALRIPATRNELIGPTNTVIDALWDLEQRLRFCLHLHCERQRQYFKPAAEQLSNRQNPWPDPHVTQTRKPQPSANSGRKSKPQRHATSARKENATG